MKEEMKKIIRSEHDHPRQVLGPHKTVDGTVDMKDVFAAIVAILG